MRMRPSTFSTCIFWYFFFFFKCSTLHLSDKGMGWLSFLLFLKEITCFMYSHWSSEAKLINACRISLGHLCSPGPCARIPANCLISPLLQVRSISSLVMSSCWKSLPSMVHTTTPTGFSLKSPQGAYQYSTILLQHWNGLTENRGKSLRLHQSSKLSESPKSGK